LNILEEIYSKDNGFLSFGVRILTVISKFWVGVSKKLILILFLVFFWLFAFITNISTWGIDDNMKKMPF
jgi:hypothetical protein